MRIDPGDVEPPEIAVPEPELDGEYLALIDSSESFADQTRRLIASKAYRDGKP
jgi:hypothetical protein